MTTVLAEGYVSRRDTAIAAGPRYVVTAAGEVLCSFVVQSALGVNDFATMLTRSRDGGLTWDEARPVWPDRAGHQSIFCSRCCRRILPVAIPRKA